MLQTREDVRNVAIIAHVDHGKTTLVDGLLKQSGVFRENQAVQERVMDSGDIERERGITILSKNTAVYYKGIKINIIDTPGHADFGGEVERVLKMVNGVILVVDAFEGPMPQTRFVLSKAMALDLPVIVCINKIDRPGARPTQVIDEVLELLMDLGASDEQIDCPFVFASAKSGIATLDLGSAGASMKPLFETIIDYIPAPQGDPDAGTQMLISTIDYNEYVGRIGVGKVDNGSIKVNQECVIVNHHSPDQMRKVKISKLYEFEGLKRVEVTEAKIGSIVAVSGISDLHIGDTICSPDAPSAIPFQKISEPTISMTFSVNDSPLAGREGKYVTSRHIRDRLYRELNTDVSLRVEDTDTTESFKGIKAGISIIIDGGSYQINALDDAIHTNGSLRISAGEFTLQSRDDGIHANGMIEISNGTMDISAFEGIEATYILISGGDITIQASDDGINGAHKSSQYTPTVEITGGTVTVAMSAGDTDGIDSNGNVIITGGTVSVNGNSAFDYDGSVTFTGGTVYVNGQQVSTLPNQMMGGRMGGFGGGRGEQGSFGGHGWFGDQNGFGGFRGGNHP